MNTDIRVSTALMANRKIKRLLRSKGSGGVVQLINLWIYAAQCAPNGVLKDMDQADIMDAAGSRDENFAEHLTSLGLLDFDQNEFRIHDWTEHNHWACGAEERSERARKAAEVRWKNQGNSKVK